MADDDFGDLEETFGDDFGFGFSDDNYAGDPNVKPVVPAPQEVVKDRAFNAVTILWDSFQGQIVKKLRVEAMPASVGFSQGYQSGPQTGGKMAKVKDPVNTNFVVVSNLQPETEYVFRIVAANDAGETVGPVTPIPIKTNKFSPLRGDKSAWLAVMPKRTSGTLRKLGRRLSMRKSRPTEYFFVLENALLSWFKEVDGEEAGFLNLCKVKRITFPERDDNIGFSLHYDDQELELECLATNPNETPRSVFRDWVDTITKLRQDVGGRSTEVVRKVVDADGEVKPQDTFSPTNF